MTESEDVLASYHAADYALVNPSGAEVGESIRSPIPCALDTPRLISSEA